MYKSASRTRPELSGRANSHHPDDPRGTPAEFKAFIASELVKWRRLVEVSGATAQ
jgi:hypothetical protein